MWRDESRNAPIFEYLGWVLFLTLLVQGILFLLEPCSIAYAANGRLNFGFVVYAVIGMFFSTPGPFIALLITLRRAERISLKTYFKRIIHTPRPLTATLVVGLFCTAALMFALCCGTPNGSAWYMMPLGFLVMLPFVGIAEETGWRGFLQPELEKRMPFPIACTVTAVIWCIWHFPDWALPTSNHYGDSVIGFAIMIFVWSFVGAAIYKATKSCLACAIYHAFINSIGAIYDWNALFDAYPKTNAMIAYFGIVFMLAVVIWIIAEKISAERRKKETLEANKGI